MRRRIAAALIGASALVMMTGAPPAHSAQDMAVGDIVQITEPGEVYWAEGTKSEAIQDGRLVYQRAVDPSSSGSLWSRPVSRSGDVLTVGAASIVAGVGADSFEPTYTGKVAVSGRRVAWYHPWGFGTLVQTGRDAQLFARPGFPVRLSGRYLLLGGAPGVADLQGGQGSEQAFVDPAGDLVADLWGDTLAYAPVDGSVWTFSMPSGVKKKVAPVSGETCATQVMLSHDRIAWQTQVSDTCAGADGAIRMRDFRRLGDTTVLTSDASARLLAASSQYVVASGKHPTQGTTGFLAFPVSGGPAQFLPFPATAPLHLVGIDAATLVYRATGDPQSESLKAWLLPAVSESARALSTMGQRVFVPGQGPWTGEVIATRPLPTCQVAIKSGAATVRTLACTSDYGSLLFTWDGKNAAGAEARMGTYTWEMTASDSDGPLVRADGSAGPISGKVDLLPTVSPFKDVPTTSQFYKEIAWLASRGISTGWPDGTFRPLAPVNRDAMAAFLYRFKGKPAFTPPTVSPFKDVPTTSQFYKEIAWLASRGISTGWPDGTFRPLTPVNRDAMAAFLYRFKGKPAFTPPTVSPFKDVPTTSQFYKEIAWLASEGISKGYPDYTFRPLNPVNRDAMAAFLYRLDGLA